MVAIHIEVVDPTVHPGWDDLVAVHPNATAFHTAAWARVLCESYGYRPTYFLAGDSEGTATIVPFMEIRSWITGRRGISLPFTDECAPLGSRATDREKVLRRLVDLAGSRGWRTAEFRGPVDGTGKLPAAAEYLSHTLDLAEGEAALSRRYRSNVHRNLRKAERAGGEVENDGSPEGVREFYRLNCLTRRDHGLPPQPMVFFENLRKHVLEAGLGTLLLARYGGKAIAGAVFLHFAGNAVYKYGASDHRRQDLRPNNLVMRDGIRMLCGKGIRTLSFGRTDLAQEGLRQFKLSWGATERRLQYFRFDLRSGNWVTGQERGRAPWESVFSKMPIPVLRLLGDVAYRHVG